MECPENDIKDRTPVWDCLQYLYMDIDPSDYYERISKDCGASKYTIEALEAILFQEVLPALKVNMYDVAGAWSGLKTKYLVERILEKHRFGKRKPWALRIYTNKHWKRLIHLIKTEKLKNT